MAVFRVEKNSGYTVMSNHHLRNRALSLKAKGLLSQMLSLPEDWDYTLQGLARINRESIDAIRVFALQDFICKLPANLVGPLRRGFARRKRLYQVVGQIVAFLHGL